VSSSPVPPARVSGHLAQLDGLRALAVLAVCWHHWMPRRYHLGLNWGALGVDLFFVLSGFLITGILLDCRRTIETGEQGIAFTARRFYARRFLRIFPLYYAVLALASVGLALAPGVLVSLWTYTFNLYGAVRGGLSGSLVSHFWSLAVEEQFYLLWPWVVLCLPRRGVFVAVAVALVLGPLSRHLMFTHGFPFDATRMITPSCLDLLCGGALVGLLARAHGAAELARHPAVRLFGLVAGALALWGVWIQTRVEGSHSASALDVLVVYSRWPFFAWLVLQAARGLPGLLGRVLASRPLGYVGQISYGVYVFHAFALVLDRFGLAALPPLARLPVYALFTLVVSALSWRFFEAPINALKERFPYRARARGPAAETGPRAAA
jgi:peptidoglycan/LPS O-acetylase OafA/YrhL